jgi:hypothetical protein
MFKNTPAKTPEEYIALIDEPRRGEIQKIHEFVMKTVPNLKPHIMAGMIGYGNYHYKYASGREGDWAIIALASQKKYISVYVCASDGKEYVAEKYKKELAPASCGKSCIRYKKIDDINFNILKKVILEGVKTMQKS